VDDEGEILAHLRVRAHLLETDDPRRGVGERIEIELEHTPKTVEQGRMELAQPALSRPCRLPRVKVRFAGPFVSRLDAERGVDLLDGPPRLGEAAVGDAGDVPALLGEIGPGIAVDASDLE